MDTDGCPPDAITYNTIVRAFLDKGDMNKVMIFLQEMTNRNFSPDATTMSMLVGLLTVDGEDFEIFTTILNFEGII